MAVVSMLRIVVFGILAWMAPPLVAGALGWRGVWGSGSALVDYMIPVPVAGGVLHVPSFAVRCWRSSTHSCAERLPHYATAREKPCAQDFRRGVCGLATMEVDPHQRPSAPHPVNLAPVGHVARLP